MATAHSTPEVHLYWNPKQTRFLRARESYVDLEGGVRAGKSFALCWKILYACIDHPGLCAALTRWTQDGLDAQLKPLWRDVCRQAGVALTWHGEEEYDALPNGSRVYLRALKSSEETQRYSKLAGLTLAILGIDQAEEVPEDVFRHYVPARLSQPGFPHQVLLTPNPPMPGHWIANDFPEDNGNPSHLYIHTTMHDNVVPLGQGYIDEQEAGYERGSHEHRRLVEGKRGLVVAGVPIFGRHFDASRHLAPSLQFDPHGFLCESLDYGSRHPCVTWCQFWPTGILAVLGGVMGTDLDLEQFMPIVAEYRRAWFPGLSSMLLQQTCDPAGSARNPHGSTRGIDLLRTFGVYPVVRADANHPPVKDAALQVIVGYLSRLQPDGSPCLLLHPRFVVVTAKARRTDPVLQRVFEGGYVYDEKRSYIGTSYPHIRPAKKDGWFEHPADALAYNVIAFAPADPADQAGLIRNPVTERQARAVLRSRGLADDDRDVTQLAMQIQQGRLANRREREHLQQLRFAQRDDGEPFRWNRSPRDHGRAGY